jgi:hypothetical protein
MTEGCVFCDHDQLRDADLCFENDFCIYSSTRDPRDPPDVMPAAGAIVPKVHRASVFDLTAEEWRRHGNFCCSCEPNCTTGSLPTATHSAGTSRAGSTLTCMSSRASMTSRWPTMASDRVSRIPPTGDPIRGVRAPGGTWPDRNSSPGGAGARDDPGAYQDDGDKGMMFPMTERSSTLRDCTNRAGQGE